MAPARQALALVVGLLSGLLANYIGMPLPWMLGAMIGTTFASMAGAPISSPAALRPLVIPVLGVMLGSSITMQVLANAAHWLPTLLLMPVFVASATASSMFIYRRLGGYDQPTAYFAAVPGGLTEMVLFGAVYGGDERKVALAHGVRILFAVSFIGLVFGFGLGVQASGANRPWTPLDALGWRDMVLLAGAAVIGLILGTRLRIPAGAMLVPMILSSILHIADLVEVPPPTLFVIGAQVVMGTTVGARFSGVRLSHIGRDVALGLVTTLSMLVIAYILSNVAHLLSGTAESQAFLAFGPGGLTEMSLIALAMGQEVAYVSVAHITRIVVVVFTAPFVFRRVFRRY